MSFFKIFKGYATAADPLSLTGERWKATSSEVVLRIVVGRANGRGQGAGDRWQGRGDSEQGTGWQRGQGGQGAGMGAGGRGQATGEAVGGRLLEEVADNLRAGSDVFRCVV